MTWSTVFALAGMTGDSYSLVEMQSGPSANNLAFIEYDLALIDADHGPELVIEELLTAVFDVFSESDPVADLELDLLSLEHTELPCLVEWQLLLNAVLSDDDSSLFPAKYFPLFPAFESAFPGLVHEQIPRKSYETRRFALAYK